jgi:hypothetical protein
LITSVTSSTSNPRTNVILTATNTTANVEEEQDLVFDLSAVETIQLRIAGVEVGAGFNRLQCRATLIVNDRSKKLTLERLPVFM